MLLTKADKLKPSKARQVCHEVEARLEALDNVTVGVFSSQDRTGLEQAQAVLDDWFGVE